MNKEDAIQHVEASVQGFLNVPEMGALWDHCLLESRCLEIGAFLGKSANIISLAMGDKGFLVSVDPHAMVLTKKGLNNETSWEKYQKNIRGLSNVLAVRATSEQASTIFGGRFDVVFIDGDHEYEYVNFDINTWSKRTDVMLVHDHINSGRGACVIRAVGEFVENNPEWEFSELVSSMAILKRKTNE